MAASSLAGIGLQVPVSGLQKLRLMPPFAALEALLWFWPRVPVQVVDLFISVGSALMVYVPGRVATWALHGSPDAVVLLYGIQ